MLDAVESQSKRASSNRLLITGSSVTSELLSSIDDRSRPPPDRPTARASVSGCATTSKVTEPTRIVSPAATVQVWTSRSLTNVPFAESRSVTTSVPRAPPP